MKKFVKIAISLTLLGFLLYKVEWANVYRYIGGSNLAIVSVVFFIMIAQFPISTYRWKKSLEIHDLNFPFLSLQKFLCIGFFINNFLPTSIGGDGYRALKTVPDNGEKSRVVSAILLERILGFVVLLFLGFLGAIGILRNYQTPAIKLYILTGMLSMLLIFLWKTLGGKNFLTRFLDTISWGQKIDIIHTNYKYIRNDKKNLLRVFEYSLAFQMFAILAINLLFKSVGVKTGIADCAFIAAFAGIASVLPISINGIGVVEGSFVFSALQVGIIYDQALIVALMWRILTIPLTLICGLVYLYDMGKS